MLPVTRELFCGPRKLPQKQNTVIPIGKLKCVGPIGPTSFSFKKKSLLQLERAMLVNSTFQMFSPSSSSFHHRNLRTNPQSSDLCSSFAPLQVISKQTTTKYTSLAQTPCLIYPIVNTILDDKTNSSFHTATQG